MRIPLKYFIFHILLFSILIGCDKSEPESVPHSGKLFIIGGGKRPADMVARLVEESNLKSQGYGVILPMASVEPDSAIIYAKKQFEAQGLDNVIGMTLTKSTASALRLDSIRQASMIYISGGDQNRFMKIIENTGVNKAIKDAYKSGCIVAGTSAGAAMMSQVMITGDEKNYPEYSATFRNLEPDNIVMAEGLGLLSGAIIDQHFIKRSRYNRLISSVMDYPDRLAIGIDESTAILVDASGVAEVLGENQVILMKSTGQDRVVKVGKMGMRGIQMDVLLPGDTFNIAN